MGAPDKHTFSGNHKGQTAIICGSAPCLSSEFEVAIRHRPEAVVIGINEAAWVIRCDYLISYHADEMPRFVSRSVNKDVVTHTSKEYNKGLEDKVNYFWSGIFLGATSTGDAIQICSRMGFHEIILCGAPMNGGDGYFHSPNASETISGCPRFGNKSTHNGFVLSHQKKLTQLKDQIDVSIVKSMSGFSAEVFGKPEFIKENGAK